jgi:hypothetical protein
MKFTDEDKKRIVELRNAGKTYTQIAVSVGRSRGSVCAFISANKDLFFKVDSLFKFPVKEKPGPHNTKIENPPKDVPPIDSRKIPFLETTNKQCKWIVDSGFWDEVDKTAVCCGNDVYKKNYCKYHYQWSVKTND